MRYAFAALLIAASAAASHWDFESAVYKDRQALRTATESAGSEVRYLTQLSLEQEKIPLLKRQVDLGVAGANEAAGHARTLNNRCQQAWSEADNTMRGFDHRPAPEKVVPATESTHDELNSYLARLNQSIGAFSSGDSSLRNPAIQALSDARQALDRIDSKMRGWKDDLDQMQSRYRQLRLLKDDIQRAADNVSDSASSMQNQAPPTKASFDALGNPPDNEKRTAASQRIDEFRAPLGTLMLASSTLVNRSDDFSRHWTAFDKSLEDFDSISDSDSADLKNARRSLDLAAGLIDQLRISQQNANNR